MEKTKKNELWQGWGWTFLVVLIMELFEEVLEETIAFGVTVLISKAISTLFVVTITQSIKLVIKRIIKSITYKGGNDKMKFIKNIFTFLWGNKLTTIEVGVSAFAGYCAYLMNFFEPFWANVAVGIGAGFVGSIIAVRLGGETLKQIVTRLAQSKLNKEQLAQAAEAEKNAKQYAEKVKKIYNELKQEKLLMEDAELKAKAEALALANPQEKSIQ
jgi:hypothetical protein